MIYLSSYQSGSYFSTGEVLNEHNLQVGAMIGIV
jgi:hypothetical protein